MALVSYGASDDSDFSEEEEEEAEKEKASVAVSAGKTTAFQTNGHISDEEDEFLGGGNFTTTTYSIPILFPRCENSFSFEWISGDEDYLIPEKEEPDVFSLIAKKLPQVPYYGWKPHIDNIDNLKYYQALKVKKKVEVLEEIGPIPEKKDYGDKVVAPQLKLEWPLCFSQVEEPPAKKAKRSGPVKITIPSLSTFQDEEDESG